MSEPVTQPSIWTAKRSIFFWKKRVPSYKTVILSSGLPAAVQELISTLVRKARLKAAEQTDVAIELISHFQDALEAGASAEEAVRKFGDIATAARLIRRAKIRNRSLLWKIGRAARWGLAGLVVLYVGSGVYFFAGRPTVKIDYVAKLNETALSVPKEQRAWPVYRQALLQIFPPADEGKNDELRTLLFEGLKEGKEREVAAAFSNLQPQMLQIREATRLPVFGFVAGNKGDANDPEMGFEPAKQHAAGMAEWLVQVSLPYLNRSRHLSNMLFAHGKVSARQSDADLTYANIMALHGLAEQMRQDSTLIGQLVASGVRSQSIDLAREVLHEHPALLSKQQLRQMAHLFSGPKVAADLMSYEGERDFFYDFVQRTYTDNGKGDGRITPVYFKFSNEFGLVLNSESKNKYPVAEAAASGLVTMTFAGRKELTVRYDRIMDIAIANLSRPMRETDWAGYDKVVDEDRTILRRIRFLPLTVLMPYLKRPQETCERVLAAQEGLIVAIALELYRRDKGSYPESLQALVPNYLPAVPADRIDGKPLRYLLDESGKPVVYSVGADLDDDGGRSTTKADGWPSENGAVGWDLAYEIRNDRRRNGDWILFPPLPDLPQGNLPIDWDGDGQDDQQQALKASEPVTQPSTRP